MNLDEMKLSASSIKTYKQCGRKFQYSKILKVEPTHEPYHYGWVGTIVHNSIYYSIADYVDGAWVVSNVKDISAVKEFFIDVWDGSFSLEITKSLLNDKELDEKQPLFKPASLTDAKYVNSASTESDRWKIFAWDLIKKGYVLFTQYLYTLSDNPIEDIKLEQEINFKFDEDYTFIGYVDVLINVKGNYVFFDLKTSKTPPKNLDLDVQFYMYRYALKKIYDLTYYPVGYYVHLRSGSLIPAKTLDSSVITKAHTQVTSAIEGIEKEDFFATLGSPLCGFCEYRGYCYNNKTPKSHSDKENQIDAFYAKYD